MSVETPSFKTFFIISSSFIHISDDPDKDCWLFLIMYCHFSPLSFQRLLIINPIRSTFLLRFTTLPDTYRTVSPMLYFASGLPWLLSELLLLLDELLLSSLFSSSSTTIGLSFESSDILPCLATYYICLFSYFGRTKCTRRRSRRSPFVEMASPLTRRKLTCPRITY